MKTSTWFIIAFVAIVIVAIVIKRRQSQSEGARMMDDAFEDLAMSPAIDNGADLSLIDPNQFSWTVS